MPQNDKQRTSRLERNKIEAERIVRADALLKEHNKKKGKILCDRNLVREFTRKKKGGYFLVDSMPILQRLSHLFIRDPSGWKSTHYNINRQRMEFIKWILCKYQPPHFMVEWLANYNLDKDRRSRCSSIETENDMFLGWFCNIATGKSFATTTKGFFTKKEAHLFLSAPRENSIHRNILWARCKAVGMPENLMRILLQRKGDTLIGPDSWWNDVIAFVGRVVVKEPGSLTPHILQDLMDFFDAVSLLTNDRINFAGRTLQSVIRLSNYWHQQATKAKFTGSVSWEAVVIPTWIWYDDRNKIFWGIKQLTSSKELYREGQAMHHCVYSYTDMCVAGHTAIFSVKTFFDEKCSEMDERRATLELDVGSKSIVQAKGKMNEIPPAKDMNVISKWAHIHGLRLSEWL